MSSVMNPNPNGGSPAANSVSSATIADGSIVDADINASAAIDASKIANGSVSSTEFQYLDGVTSAVQTQLNGKQASGSYQPLDSELTAIAGLTSAANTVPSFTGSGTAALLTVGTGASNLVQLDGSSKLPAVDGSALTNLPSSAPTSDNGWFSNIGIVRATTTDANDSIKITSAGGTALSAGNAAKIRLPSIATLGQVTEFTMTADVTIKLTGATWYTAGLGDLASAILRVYAMNDNGTLKWGVALKGGMENVATANTTATQASVVTGEFFLCNSAIGSATNTCRELGYFYASFDDTGGAHEDLWAVDANVNSIVVGRTADGMWQPFNPNFSSGFGTPPTVLSCRMMQQGRTVRIYFEPNAWGTANNASMTFDVPFKPSRNALCTVSRVKDNGTVKTVPGGMVFNSGSKTCNIFLDISGGTSWAGAGSSGYYLDNVYEV